MFPHYTSVKAQYFSNGTITHFSKETISTFCASMLKVTLPAGWLHSNQPESDRNKARKPNTDMPTGMQGMREPTEAGGGWEYGRLVVSPGRWTNLALLMTLSMVSFLPLKTASCRKLLSVLLRVILAPRSRSNITAAVWPSLDVRWRAVFWTTQGWGF